MRIQNNNIRPNYNNNSIDDPKKDINNNTTHKSKETTAAQKSSGIQAIDTLGSNAPADIKDVVFVGSGSSIAYCVNDTCENIEREVGGTQGDKAPTPLAGAVLIGSTEPWSANVRGAGYINHQNEIIEQWGSTAPQYDKSYADRQQFSNSNLSQIERAKELGMETIDDEAIKIKTVDNGLFQVTTKEGREFISRRVILGIGAGAHTNALADSKDSKATTAEKRLNNISVKDKDTIGENLFNIDEFMRFTDNQENSLVGKTIVLHGPNAGIDVAEKASMLGAKVIWATRSSSPFFLDGNQLKYAPKVAKENLIKVDKLAISAADNNNGLKITTTDHDGKSNTLEADYYVYALGQDSE